MYVSPPKSLLSWLGVLLSVSDHIFVFGRVTRAGGPGCSIPQSRAFSVCARPSCWQRTVPYLALLCVRAPCRFRPSVTSFAVLSRVPPLLIRFTTPPPLSCPSPLLPTTHTSMRTTTHGCCWYRSGSRWRRAMPRGCWRRGTVAVGQ